jgi:pimeloyl-ACP methyl ester carboxylesterase
MPVPIRDDGRPGPTRRLIVFVHGFRSSKQTWNQMHSCLQQDESVTSEFDLAFFDYETAIAAVPVVGALPTLEQAGKSLAAWLKNALFAGGTEPAYINVTLVGHSMGGLIIQACLLALLRPDGDPRELQSIRQVILFATPNFGSTVLGAARRFLSLVVSNPQEQALRLFSPDGVRIHEEIRDRVIFATQRARDECPIPFYCFSGRTDGIVRPESAMGHFPAGEPLPGGHFDVHCPPTRDDPRYVQFVNAVRSPHGHQEIWEVERFIFTVKISPAAPGTQVTARYGDRERAVTYDNVAQIVRRVVFSPNNRCRKPYVLKYGTRNGGWVVPTISQPHITPPDKLRLYDDTGTDAYYEVEPVPGTTSTLGLTLYKGFDQGHRDYHMHLGRTTFFRRLVFEVDLSDYRAAGWGVTTPRLYFHLTDPGDHALCGQRRVINADPPSSVDDRGVWTWDLEHLTEGVVDLVFDVEPPQADVQPRTIALKAGEHAIFGYGSLLSITSLERTLGRSYAGPFQTCQLRGWRRRWNVAMPNKAFVYRDGGAWVTPDKIFYLNVERDEASSVNGILFVVSTEELKQFDEREWIYDRVDVSERLADVRVEGGAAWVYGGKPEFTGAHPAGPGQGAIRRTYLNILRDGHRDLGSTFAATYAATTEPVPPNLVFYDVRRVVW